MDSYSEKWNHFRCLWYEANATRWAQYLVWSGQQCFLHPVGFPSERNVSSEEHGQHQPKHCWELTILHRNSSERYHRLQGAGKVMTPFEGRKGKKEDCVVPAQGLLGTAFAFLYTGRNAFPFLLFIQFHRSLCSTALTAIAARQVRAASPAAQPPNQPPPDLKDLERREGA